MEKQRGSVEAIKKIVELGKKISVDEMIEIANIVTVAGGSLVAVDPDGDWCGTGKIRFKWPPPKPKEFDKFLDTLVQRYINFEILINGIPWPDVIQINVSRQIGR
jgi:hypothetical protein